MAEKYILYRLLKFSWSGTCRERGPAWDMKDWYFLVLLWKRGNLEGCYLPYVITRTFHPPQVNTPRLKFLTPARGRYSIYLLRRDGRLSWPGWLVTYRDYLPAHCILSPWNTYGPAKCEYAIRPSIRIRIEYFVQPYSPSINTMWRHAVLSDSTIHFYTCIIFFICVTVIYARSTESLSQTADKQRLQLVFFVLHCWPVHCVPALFDCAIQKSLTLGPGHE